MVKKTYQVADMHCTSCAVVIEGELEDAGASSVKCSFAKQTLEIEYDEAKISEDKIKEVVKQSGYTLVG